ncbi:MAG: ATP-binding cassette domain-containing protein [Tissierellia bacterium]|nr:ATP-binding cassette domain-containing protein [Tissierellia bacterium]
MIEVKNLFKKIDGNIILNNINLKLDYGKIYGFQGHNGSGKTMLFRAICGLINIDSGEIIVDNKKIYDNDFLPDVGLLLENPSFINGLSGFMNLKMIASIKNIACEKRILEVLDIVGLTDAKNKLYEKYSLGMKQRLAIANVIMEDPKILIFDEPNNAIDKDGVEILKEIIIKEKEKGKLILISSHEKGIIDELSYCIFNMENGKIISKDYKLTN